MHVCLQNLFLYMVSRLFLKSIVRNTIIGIHLKLTISCSFCVVFFINRFLLYTPHKKSRSLTGWFSIDFASYLRCVMRASSSFESFIFDDLVGAMASART